MSSRRQPFLNAVSGTPGGCASFLRSSIARLARRSPRLCGLCWSSSSGSACTSMEMLVMHEVLLVILPVFGIVGTGYAVGRTKVLGDDVAHASSVLNSFVFYLCMPAFLFLSMSRVHEPMRVVYICAYACAMIATAAVA